MRSYGQYCAVAKALDVVGDRWTLLIVRELLIRGSCRYTDLRDGLPGIATNLLADRLRELEEAGVLRREAAPPPIATTLFQLTARGRELRRVVEELAEWGTSRLIGSAIGDVFRSHWLVLPLQLRLRDRRPDLAPVTIEVRAGDEPLVLEISGGTVEVRQGSVPDPDAMLIGAPQQVFGVLTGSLRMAEARAAGLQYVGDPEILQRVQPEPIRVEGNGGQVAAPE